MARPITFVKEEILRVAKDLNISPRSQSFTRAKFLNETEVTKHDLETYSGFTRLKKDAADEAGISPIEHLAEARGVQLRRNYVRKLERKLGETEYFADKLDNLISTVFEENPIELSPGKVKFDKKKTKKRKLTLLLSDLHFGVDVDSREVYNNEFNWNIAARRLAKMCHQAAEFKRQYREETELQVVLNGDIIHGVIHLNEANIKPITEQIYGATSILIKALDYLRNHFSKVSVLCLPGNHDRTVYRGKERQVSQRWDTHSHSVYLGLKAAFRGDKGISFDIPMTGMGTYTTPGDYLIFATHGDVEPGVGNVGKSFNVKKTTESLLKMHAGAPFNKKIDVALFGHWHQPSVWMLQDGTICVVNGCLIGSDPYAQNGVGFFNTMPAQIMFESVDGYPFGGSRIIQLKDADTEKQYDKIIKPPGLIGGLDFDI